MAFNTCDGNLLSPRGANRNLREEVGSCSRSKTRKLAQGFAGVLEAVLDFLKHGVPTKTWHVLLRGVTGCDAGDAGDGWQNLFGDGLKWPT